MIKTNPPQYPWYMVDYITIEDRELLYQTTVNMIVLLKDRIERNPMDTNLTTMLFKRVWRAGLKCPGFSPTQKEDIVFTAGIGYDFAAELGLPPFADYWGDLWAIGPKPGVPYDAVFVSFSSSPLNIPFEYTLTLGFHSTTQQSSVKQPTSRTNSPWLKRQSRARKPPVIAFSVVSLTTLVSHGTASGSCI